MGFRPGKPKGNKPPKPSRADKKIERMKKKAEYERTKTEYAIEKARRGADLAKAKYEKKANSKYGMNDTKLNTWERKEKIKTREEGKRAMQNAVAHNIKYGNLYGSINNTVDSLFDYNGWDIVAEDSTSNKGKDR